MNFMLLQIFKYFFIICIVYTLTSCQNNIRIKNETRNDNILSCWNNLFPERTPYDYDKNLSTIYLNAFKKGIESAIETKGNPQMLSFYPQNEKEQAYADGFNHGRFLIHSVIQLNLNYQIEKTTFQKKLK